MLNIDELLRNVVPSDAPMSLRAIQDEIRASVEEKYIQKLDGYKQINQICDLLRGRHIRWLRNSQLTNGAILVDIKFLDSGTHLLCKNPIGKMFQIKYDDCVIFQRMTADEILVAYAMSREPTVCACAEGAYKREAFNRGASDAVGVNPLRPLPHNTGL